MELQQDSESAREDPPSQAAGPQYAQQPFQPGAQPVGGQSQPLGPQQQWPPGMPYPPYGAYPQQWNPGQWNPGMPYPPRGRGRTAQNLVICFGALMIALIVFVAVSVIAHSTQGTRTGASSNSQANGDTGADGNNAPAGNTPTGTQTAQVGSAITLAGLSAGEQMSVTVTKIYSDAQPVDQYSEAPVGDRLYAVEFQLKNTGRVGYSDAPTNSAVVFDSDGQSYQTQFDDVTECPSFRTVLDIPVGGTSVGCIAYEVPNNAKITKIQVILDSGYGPQTGEWKIGKSAQ
jgi:hypothetical protein